MADSAATDPQPRNPRHWILPLIAPFLGLLIASLLAVPMLGAKAENLPVALINADTGITLPTGESLNAGSQAVDALISADQQVLDFTVVTGDTSIEDLLEDEGYYAVLEIPADFSQASAAAQAEAGQAPAMTASVDQAKTMMGAQTATTALTAISQKSPVAINITTVNAPPSEWGFAGSLAPMILFMGTFISSLVSSLLLTASQPLTRPGRSTWVGLGIQLAYGAIAAFLVGFGTSWLVQTLTGLELPFTQLALFLSALAAGYIALTSGFINLIGTQGAALSALTMLLGIATLTLPRQFLPSFWSEWIYPWIPARFAGQGIRDILFAGEGWLNTQTGAFFWMLAIGLALMAVAAGKQHRSAQKAG